jgi:hypothetical protein
VNSGGTLETWPIMGPMSDGRVTGLVASEFTPGYIAERSCREELHDDIANE